MLPSDEKEEMFDDWEEDDGFPSDEVDADGFPGETGDGGFEETSPQQQMPAKKKRGGGVLLFLLILLGGVGGGFYFLTTPGGAPYRDYLPEVVRGFLPAAEAPEPKMASVPGDRQVADALDGDVKADATQASDAVDPLGFQAPPMPSLSATEGTATADDSTENGEGFASFGGTTDDAATDETVGTDSGEAAWGSDTPSEDGVTALSFDSVADAEATAADETPVLPVMGDVADDKAAISDSLTGHVAVDTEKQQQEASASSFSAAANQAPAVKTEQLIDLEDRMSVLEKAVSGLEKTVVTKKDLSALKGDVSSLQADIRALRGESKNAASASVPRNVAPAPKAASSSSAANTAKPAAAAKATPQREWVMVSAQPGTAWISEKGRSGKREVSVGDTVPGLGRITSIAPSADTGRWLVKGTRGTLHQ